MIRPPNPGLYGRKCRVYLNLHLPGRLSIQSAEKPDRGRVIAHARLVELMDCAFRVSEPGRQRVIAQKCKNVHAFIEGYIVRAEAEASNQDDAALMMMRSLGCGVYYSPYKTPTFIDPASGKPILFAKRVLAIGKLVAADGTVLLPPQAADELDEFVDGYAAIGALARLGN